MRVQRLDWFRLALQFRGSVIPAVLPRTLLCGGFGLVVAQLYFSKLVIAQPIFRDVVPSIVLGLLLVFRTNTAYDRFWEGRKCWGMIVNTVRNLARQIWVVMPEYDPQDQAEKIAMLRLLVAFAVATKLHLRQQPINHELETLVKSSQFIRLQNMNNPPLEIAFWISDYLQNQYHRDRVTNYQMVAMQHLLDILVDMLGGCERILKTPIPLAYSIHLKQLLLIYCLLLPFQMVRDLGWVTGPIVALVSFTLLGIEAIGTEIENPFGDDPNDLPLDAICATMLRNVEDLITLSPTAHSYRSEITSNDIMITE